MPALSVQIPQVALTTDLENLKQSRITTQREVEQNADVEVQKILNNANTMIQSDEARVRDKVRKRSDTWNAMLRRYGSRVQTLQGETQTFNEMSKSYQGELGNKMKTQEELLTEAQQAMDTGVQTVNSGVDEITGSGLQIRALNF